MKPTIVLVHGAFAESASWDRVIDSLSGAGHRVIAAANPLRGPAPVEQLRELLDAQGLPYFRSFVRRYVAHPQSQLDGLPVTAYRGDRSWRAAVDDVRRVQVELLIELGRLAERTPA